jgi:AraC-like DNA-binding protein
VSLRQLERHFAVHLQKTPREWTRDLRLRLAQDLISHGWSSKAVAAELNFADSSHLCREFKKRCGTTPQSFAPFTFLAKARQRERMSHFYNDMQLNGGIDSDKGYHAPNNHR